MTYFAQCMISERHSALTCVSQSNAKYTEELFGRSYT